MGRLRSFVDRALSPLAKLPPGVILGLALLGAILATAAIISFQREADRQHEAGKLLIELEAVYGSEQVRYLVAQSRGRLLDEEPPLLQALVDDENRLLAELDKRDAGKLTGELKAISEEYRLKTNETFEMIRAGRVDEARAAITNVTRPLHLKRVADVNQATAKFEDGSDSAEQRAAVGTGIITIGGAFCVAGLFFVVSRLRNSAQLATAQLKEERDREQERERIGMDLHDGVMQDIYAVGLMLELAQEDLEATDSPAKTTIERSIAGLHDVVRDIRSYVFDLRPREFAGELPNALQSLALEFQENSRIATRLALDPTLAPLPSEQQAAFYHIAHEALSNARKHAGPNSITMSLTASEGSAVLEIRDDGAGFDTTRELPERHRGMRNMVRRAREAGSQFSATSAPGQGTTIRVTAALPAPRPEVPTHADAAAPSAGS